MIVAKGKAREVAVEIKDYVAVNVYEEVALALFGIDESLDLCRIQ